MSHKDKRGVTDAILRLCSTNHAEGSGASASQMIIRSDRGRGAFPLATTSFFTTFDTHLPTPMPQENTHCSPASSTLKPFIYAPPFAKGARPRQLLNERQQEELLKRGTLVSLSKGQVLYKSSDKSRYIYNVIRGIVQEFSIQDSKSDRIISFIFPGDVLGLNDGDFYASNARALSDARVYQFRPDELLKLMETDPPLQLQLLCKACQTMRELQRHILQVSHSTAHARVAAFLLLLWRHTDDLASIPTLQPEKALLDVPMTQQDIADYSALTVETVSRAFSFLEKSGAILRTGRRSVELSDLTALQRLAGEI